MDEEGTVATRVATRDQRDLAAHYDILADAVLVEADDVWVYANPAALTMLKCRDERDVLGSSTLDIIPPEDRPMVMARNAKALAGGRNPPIRQRLIRADGTMMLGEISSQSIALTPGSRNIMIIVRDVTDRVADETRFTATFEQAAVGIAHLGLDGRWLRVNRKLSEMLDYSASELLERTIVEITHPDDREQDVEVMDALRSGSGESFTSEKRYLCNDGGFIWVNCTRSLVRTFEGKPDYIIAVVEDIHQRKQAEEALRASEERFRHLVEYGTELIVVVDANGEMTYVAPTVATLLGYDPAEVVGQSAFAFIHPDDLPASVARVQRIAATPGARENASIRVRSSDRTWRIFEISTANLLNDPSVRGLVVNGHDVTRTARMAEELAQLKRIESLGRVAAAVAHEFNNVLAGADAFATVLARRNDPSLEPIAKGLKAAISRGKQITAPILQYGQPAVLSRTRFEVAPWLRDLHTEIGSLLGGRNPVTVIVKDQLFVNGDRRLLSQVLTNLVLNARDASPPGAGIVISAHATPDGGVAIDVRDGGHGIPAEARDRIFEPLFTTKHNGTGLGLAVVQQIVIRHGGTVSAASEPGNGAVFTVTLP
jgi:PAS domain S-box-containing protein